MKLLNNLFKTEQKEQVREDTQVDYDKSLDNRTVTIPEPEITNGGIPTCLLEHNTFNIVRTMNFSGVGNNVPADKVYRLKSENAKEVFRMKCIGHDYDIISVNELAPGMFHWDSVYMRKDKQYHFITRVFVTKYGNYFYQYIRGDNTAAYAIVNPEDVQKIAATCESNDEVKYFSRNFNNRCHYVPKPGTYTPETYTTTDEAHRNGDEYIESFEIIDKDLYSNIIEEL